MSLMINHYRVTAVIKQEIITKAFGILKLSEYVLLFFNISAEICSDFLSFSLDACKALTINFFGYFNNGIIEDTFLASQYSKLKRI